MNDAAAIAIVQEVLATAKTNTDTLAKVFVEVTALKTTNGTLTEAIAALEQQIADMDNVPAALAESLTELKEVVGAQTTSLTALDQLNPDTPPAEGNPG